MISLYDIENYLEILNKNVILNYIKKYQLPSYPKEKKVEIKNLNIFNMEEKKKIKYAITLNKTIIKSFPTNRIFKKSKKDVFNRTHLTALPINSSVLVIHKSLDKKWVYIISKLYTGWIQEKYVLYVNKKNFTSNIHKTNFITIIKPFFKYKKYIFDAVTTFEYSIIKDRTYLHLITNRGIKKIFIPKDKFSYGYLKFDRSNVIKEALKFIGIKYYLGDDLYKLDCSSFIGNVLKTFNKIVPRDTKDIIKSLKVSDFIEENDSAVQLLHFKGHIALYLGKNDNKYYYVHASGKRMCVTVDYLGEHYLDFKDIIGVSVIDYVHL